MTRKASIPIPHSRSTPELEHVSNEAPNRSNPASFRVPPAIAGQCLCGAVQSEMEYPAFWAWHDHSRPSPLAQGTSQEWGRISTRMRPHDLFWIYSDCAKQRARAAPSRGGHCSLDADCVPRLPDIGCVAVDVIERNRSSFSPRMRGIAKNGAQVFSLLAFANLYLARRRLASA
jgi:hypothetical protein